MIKQAKTDCYVISKNSCNLPNNFPLVILDAQTSFVAFE